MGKLPKLPILWKNTSNKNCSQLNFLLISQWTHMSISPRSGVRGLQRLRSLNRFTLGFNAAKNMHYIKKKNSNKCCSELNFVQRSLWVHMSISPTSGGSDLQRSVCLKFYNEQKWEIIFIGAQHCQKCTSHQKKLQIKVVWNWI